MPSSKRGLRERLYDAQKEHFRHVASLSEEERARRRSFWIWGFIVCEVILIALWFFI